MNQQKLNPLLLVGIGLIAFSLLSSNFSFPGLGSQSVDLPKPSDPVLVELASPVISALNGSGEDGRKLSNLYNDLATLIEINDDIIKNTEEIREANRIAGKMSKLDLKGKYPNLGEAANNMIIKYIGNENAALSDDLRSKSVSAFRALAWACKEGS
jgi:hypothetical protein